MSRLRPTLEGDLLPTAVIAETTDDYPPRVEKRDDVVKIVEYSHYPRIARDERRNIGFTRDQSRSGLGIAAHSPEAPGTLLKVALRNVDGGVTFDALARVVWCQARQGGRYWMGLSLLDQGRRSMLKMRRNSSSAQLRTCAS
jgi:hypothetical protein